MLTEIGYYCNYRYRHMASKQDAIFTMRLFIARTKSYVYLTHAGMYFYAQPTDADCTKDLEYFKLVLAFTYDRHLGNK